MVLETHETDSMAQVCRFADMGMRDARDARCTTSYTIYFTPGVSHDAHCSVCSPDFLSACQHGSINHAHVPHSRCHACPLSYLIADSPSSALRELGQVFEGFAVEAWLADEQARRCNKTSKPQACYSVAGRQTLCNAIQTDR